MNQVSQEIRQAIAKRPEIKNPDLKQLLAMDDETLEEELDQRGERLTASGYPNKAVQAYQDLAWLLAEREAVQAYVRTAGNTELIRILPDLATVEETLEAARMEYRLDGVSLMKLRILLQRLMAPRSRGNAQNSAAQTLSA